MYLPRPEFAGSEFASVEFASGAFGFPVETEFAIANSAIAAFDGGAIAHAQATAHGETAVAVQAAAVVLARTQIQSSTTVTPHYDVVAEAAFSGASQTDVDSHSGVGLPTEFAVEGRTEVAFEPLVGYEFRLSGGTTLVMVGFTTAQASFDGAGESVADFLGQEVHPTRADIQSETAVDWSGQSMAYAAASGESSTTLALQSHRALVAAFSIAGVSAVQARGASMHGARFASAGATSVSAEATSITRRYAAFQLTSQSTPDFQGLPRVYTPTEFRSAGATAVSTQANYYQPSRTQITSRTTVEWLRGSQVMATMDPAYDIVERPEEERAVERV